MRSDRVMLLGALAPLALAIATLLALCIVGFNMLSAVRAYVGGESLWSKARAEAVAHLRSYAAGGHAGEYRRFTEALAVPLGDRAARLELDKPRPDMAAVQAGFIAGENAPEDIPGLVRLYRWFRHVDFMEEAVDTWIEGDRLIERVQDVGERIHAQVESAGAPLRYAPLLSELDALDTRLVSLEKYFSATLGRASRSTERVLVAVTLVLAALLALGGALLLRRSMRRELADRRLLVDANERWRLGADAAGIGLFDWNSDDDRFELDERAATLFGAAEAGGASLRRAELRALLHRDDQAFARQRFDEALREGGLFENRCRVALPGGTVRHLEAIGRVRAGRAGDNARMVGIVRDVGAELAQAQLAVDKEAAERAARLRVEFLTQLSHQLRTPLNAVLGAAQLLSRDATEPPTRNQQKRLAMLLDGGEQLRRLVDDVLDLTRFEDDAPGQALGATDMLAAARDALDTIEAERAALGIRVDDRLPHRPAMVRAQARPLQQAFARLLGDGCRRNPRGGLLALEYREDERHAWVTIAEQGTGAGADHEPGGGLGVMAARLLLERMQGAVSVERAPGGCRFTVRLTRA